MSFAQVRDVDLYYEVHGNGDPILLIPGLGSDANTWAPFVPAFSSYRTILIENRGSGRSAKPPGPYTTEEMADDAAAILDYLGINRAHVIGKSMGGMIAQILAAKYPTRVRSLVLASSLMKHDGYGAELVELGRLIAEKAGLFATYRQAFLMSYSREYCITTRGRLAEVAELMAKMDQKEVMRGYHGQSIACELHDSRNHVQAIRCPTLVIVGAEDIITPPQASRELAAAIAGAELVILPRGGHGFWREFPEDVNPIVRNFLARN
ncbi:MAG: alpha/beta hydrolase [Acidobacteria bacterium]|nr:MAG: alpha/beta hydrolase [Acidobacteriota bacterium]